MGGFESSPSKKRLIGLENAGHLAFSDLCNLGADKGGLAEIATQYGVTGASFASFLWDGCDEGQLPFEAARDIVNYSTTVVLKETLHCDASRVNLLPILRLNLKQFSSTAKPWSKASGSRAPEHRGDAGRRLQ